jgi:hypothetical protein
MQSALLSLVLFFVSSVMASPQWAGGRGNFGGSTSSPSSSQSGGNSRAGSINTSSSPFIQRHNTLVAHAVTASLAWAFLFPIGAIFLRLNINHPIMLQLHILTQLLAYLVFTAGAGLGIWLALQSQQYYPVWSDPHPIIGLVLLALATLQPLTGWIHHRIYKSRAVVLATTNRGPRPGRTVWGRLHLWSGRALIPLGIVNGGLGLRLMESSPIQDRELTRDAEIGYGIAAGLVWCIYVFITLLWEGMRSARKRKMLYESARARRRGKSQRSSDSSLRPEPKMPG